MQQHAAEEKPVDRLEALNEALESGTMQQARRMFNALPPAEIGHLLESFPSTERKIIWELVDPKKTVKSCSKSTKSFATR